MSRRAEALTTSNMTFKIRSQVAGLTVVKVFSELKVISVVELLMNIPHGLFFILFFSLVLKALFASYKNTIPELKTLGTDCIRVFSVFMLS